MKQRVILILGFVFVLVQLFTHKLIQGKHEPLYFIKVINLEKTASAFVIMGIMCAITGGKHSNPLRYFVIVFCLFYSVLLIYPFVSSVYIDQCLAVVAVGYNIFYKLSGILFLYSLCHLHKLKKIA